LCALRGKNRGSREAIWGKEANCRLLHGGKREERGKREVISSLLEEEGKDPGRYMEGEKRFIRLPEKEKERGRDSPSFWE